MLAQMIAGRIGCDLYRIQAADPYSDDYDATVHRNYDVILLGSPIWNVRPPMIMKTFTGSRDFTGKRVHSVVTYAVSGLGTAEGDYTESCPGATMAHALAVQGEKVAGSGRDVDTWLRATGLVT